MPLEISYEIEERLEDEVIATFDELLVAFCRCLLYTSPSPRD